MPVRQLRAIVFAAAFTCAFAHAAPAQKVLVTYFSQTGHTKTMAEAVARGARSVAGTDVRVLPIDKTAQSDLTWADAIIVGTPVQNANVAAPVLQAIASWPFTGLRDKVGAAFVTGGWISGGQELTQAHLLVTLLEFGLVIVGGEDSMPFGAAAITSDPLLSSPKGEGAVDPKFLARGEALGRRVAERTAWLLEGRSKPAERRGQK